MATATGITTDSICPLRSDFGEHIAGVASPLSGLLGRAWDRAFGSGEHGMPVAIPSHFSPEVTGADMQWLRWLVAVDAVARGSYGSALRILVATTPQRLADLDSDRVAVAYGVLLGSLYRQLSRHNHARQVDEYAWRRAHLSGDPTLVHEAALGLAADHVGLRDSERAQHWWGVADGAADPGDWRQQVRLGWVRAERALLDGDPAAAQTVASRAVALAHDHGARRHETKSRLFAAVAELAGHADANSKPSSSGYRNLEAVARVALDRGWWPLAWPAYWVCAQSAMHGSADSETAARFRASTHALVAAIGVGLPPGLDQHWRSSAPLATPDAACLPWVVSGSA